MQNLQMSQDSQVPADRVSNHFETVDARKASVLTISRHQGAGGQVSWQNHDCTGLDCSLFDRLESAAAWRAPFLTVLRQLKPAGKQPARTSCYKRKCRRKVVVMFSKSTITVLFCLMLGVPAFCNG